MSRISGKCIDGQHPFKEIHVSRQSDGSYAVVRWCPICGCVVVDMDYDGRTAGGRYYELNYPEITRKFGLDWI